MVFSDVLMKVIPPDINVYSATAVARKLLNSSLSRAAFIFLRECPHMEDFGGQY
jgi:hypothetical protein